MYDVIGDVHGCLPELVELLDKLGYKVKRNLDVVPPTGRRLVFVGDLVDRGPDIPGTLRLVMRGDAEGTLLTVLGNHDDKLRRTFDGENPKSTSGGRAVSLAQLEKEPKKFRREVRDYLAHLPSRLDLDTGRLVVVHAGLPPRDVPDPRHYYIYGEKTGRKDEFGYEEREDWASHYTGAATVAYGHTPNLAPELKGTTINLDTGCVFGGRLTALRYPEMTFESVPARAKYADSRRFTAARKRAGLE